MPSDFFQQRWDATLVGVLLSTTSVGIVAATGGSHGWTSCNWSWKEAAADPNIYIRDDGSFPGDVIRDGVLNSFQGRINEAIGEWSSAMANLGLRGRLIRVSSGAQVFLHYQTQENALFGITFATTDTGVNNCLIHNATNRTIRFADVYISIRGDWFTQGADRRALWENCPYNGLQPAYTCSKKPMLVAPSLMSSGTPSASLLTQRTLRLTAAPWPSAWLSVAGWTPEATRCGGRRCVRPIQPAA